MRHLAELARAVSPRPAPRDAMIRAVTASAVGQLKAGAEAALSTLYGEDEKAGAILKAVASPGTTAPPGWAAELVQAAVADFIGGLVPASAAAALLRRGSQHTFGAAAGAVTLPSLTTDFSAAWTAEGTPIGVTQATLDGTQLEPKTLAAITVLSERMLKAGAAEGAVRLGLTEAAGRALDAKLFSADAATDAAPAGLLNGIAPLAGWPGGDDTAALADMSALIGAVAAVAGGGAVIIAHPLQAIVLQARMPGLVVLQSGVMPAGRLIAAAPAALASGTGGLDFAISRETLVHMSDTPLEIVADGGPTAGSGNLDLANPLRRDTRDPRHRMGASHRAVGGDRVDRRGELVTAAMTDDDDDIRAQMRLNAAEDLARGAAILRRPRPAPEARAEVERELAEAARRRAAEPAARQPSPPAPTPAPDAPTKAWQSWIRRLVDKRTDALVEALGVLIADHQHVAGLRHHEAERRLAEAEARLDAMEHRLTLATEDAPPLRVISGGQP